MKVESTLLAAFGGSSPGRKHAALALFAFGLGVRSLTRSLLLAGSRPVPGRAKVSPGLSFNLESFFFCLSFWNVRRERGFSCYTSFPENDLFNGAQRGIERRGFSLGQGRVEIALAESVSWIGGARGNSLCLSELSEWVGWDI